MIFLAEPKLYIRIANKYIQRATGMKGFYFDENGEFETDNPVLIKVLSQRLKVKEEVNEANKNDNPAVRHCKKCDFTCSNQGELLKHYREKHPKEG